MESNIYISTRAVSAAYLLSIAEMARTQGATLIFVYPSTLIPPQKVQAQVTKFLQDNQANYEYFFFDFSEAITDHLYFNDPDHLNTVGIEHFTKDFLAPALANLPQR